MLSTTANTSQEDGLAYVLCFNKAVCEAKETASINTAAIQQVAPSFSDTWKESQRLALPCCVLRLCTSHKTCSCESSAGSQLCYGDDML